MTAPAALVLGSDAASLRRRLGPASWVVLETVVSMSTEAPGGAIATASVRDLAADIGLARNTVAHAVRRLIDAELLAVVQGRGERGTFGASTYRVSLPANILARAARPDDLHAHERRAHRRSPSNTSASVEQLALLPE